MTNEKIHSLMINKYNNVTAYFNYNDKVGKPFNLFNTTLVDVKLSTTLRNPIYKERE